MLESASDNEPSSELPKRKSIFPGYHPGDLPRKRLIAAFAALAGISLLLGAVVAWLPSERLSLMVAPVVLLSLVIIWVLPQGASPPVKFMEAMFFAYFVASTFWPYYLAIDVPGLPLIEIRRVFIALAILGMLISLSISFQFRQRMSSIINSSPLIYKLFGSFVLIQIVSLPLARDLGYSLSAFVRDQLNWTAVFLMASYIFSRPGAIVRWAGLFCTMAVLMSILAFAEFRNQSVLWANHIPSFLQINDPMILKLLKPSFRGNAYRVMGPFPVSLSMAEWLALTQPFLLYYVFFGRSGLYRVICLITDLLVFVAILTTQARIGLVGMIVAHAVFIGAWALRARKLNKGSPLLPTAVISAYPVILAAIIGAVLTVPALSFRVFGGGAQAASTDSRGEQFRAALPLIINRPLNGYGVGHAALTVRWTTPGGDVSLDSYLITLLVDYGVIGFGLYVALIVSGIVYGLQLGAKSNNNEIGYAGAAAVALCIWFVCQSVLSQEDNASLIFMMLAIIAAARWRENETQTEHIVNQ
jgi:hypothetical protein